MMWKTCFILIFVIIALFIVLAVLKKKVGKKTSKILTPFNIFAIGIFLATVIGIFPGYFKLLPDETTRVLKALMFSLHDALQVFTLDSDIDFIRENITAESTALAEAYSLVMSILFVLAPFVIAGLVISLIKNISAYTNFLFYYLNEVYIFSELNERSLTLGKDLKRNHRNSLIIYTDVFDSNDETMYELLSSASEMGAVYFKKDIATINFMRHKNKMVFLVMGHDQSENIKHSIKLIDKYKNKDNTELYVLSDNIETSIILTGINKGKMKVRRVDEVQSLISRNLYENGNEIFQRAAKNHGKSENDPIKADERIPINVAIIGLGKHGTEMLKMLTWYCQMDGFRIGINAFEKDKLAEDKIKAACPELLSEKYNGVYVPGESEYYIKIYSDTDVDTATFADKFKILGNLDYIFVSLGSDSKNIQTATYIRTLCEQMRIKKPIIQTIVYDTDTKNALQDITIYDGTSKYDIEYIGDLESSYSEKVIINSELEEKGLKCHLAYCDDSSMLPEETEKFWKYEYYYRSSIATALHDKIRAERNVDRNTEATLEHRRWNAYMRAEGYIYSGSTDKASRNNLGKMHHNLVDFSKLPDSDKRKDERVSKLV